MDRIPDYRVMNIQRDMTKLRPETKMSTVGINIDSTKWLDNLTTHDEIAQGQDDKS